VPLQQTDKLVPRQLIETIGNDWPGTVDLALT